MQIIKILGKNDKKYLVIKSSGLAALIMAIIKKNA